ncbi:cytochrome P450 [Streptomyces sp. NPDC093261]|uniref:cytochrome P450 n=1 Tax=Streptomyces sp. NPDC093261 TaxID=3366037 RepID=UPI00381469BF
MADGGRLDTRRGALLLDNGIALSEGAFHRRQRRILQPGFHRARIAGYASRDLPRGTYIPFGAGNRTCIGDTLAWHEMRIPLAATLTRWRHPLPRHRARAVEHVRIRPSALPAHVTRQGSR